MTAPLGTARCYASLQPILRARADALGLSRVELDRIAGLPAGYSSKVLAEVPLRQLGPDTFGPMLGALGTMLIVAIDPEAQARYADKGEKRVEKYALNAAHRGGAVIFKISLKKLRRMSRKGGTNSRKYMSAKKASRLAKRAVRARIRKQREKAARRAEGLLAIAGGSALPKGFEPIGSSSAPVEARGLDPVQHKLPRGAGQA